MLYAKVDSRVGQFPFRDTLLGDFNVVTGNKRAGYELCVGAQGSGTRNVNSSFLLIFPKPRRQRIGDFWFQRREPRRWTWYGNGVDVVKEIDHILVSSHWWILYNSRGYRSAEFLVTDHSLVDAKLRINVRSKEMPRCNFPRFHLEKLRYPSCAHGYAVADSNRFRVLDPLENPEEMSDAFKRETLKAT